MFEPDVQPQRMVVENLCEFAKQLERLMLARGPVEWIQRA